MPLKFAKLEGTGNDFIVINNLSGEFDKFCSGLSQSQVVKLLCSRRKGIGADGLILIEDSEIANFKWKFFNADGSQAEMCGNGMRCVARFAFEEGIAPESMKVETLAGIVKAEVKGSSVKVMLTPPKDFHFNLSVEGLKAHFVNTGVPHTVIFVDFVDMVNVEELGKRIRNSPLFLPQGTNVNFVEVKLNKIIVRTYERGVEGETLACGTGAVASALIAAKVFKLRPPIEVEVRSGERLKVYFNDEMDEVFLEGPTTWVYSGELKEEVLKNELRKAC